MERVCKQSISFGTAKFSLLLQFPPVPVHPVHYQTKITKPDYLRQRFICPIKTYLPLEVSRVLVYLQSDGF